MPKPKAIPIGGAVWTRAEVFGSRWTERSLSEFVAPDSSVNWVERNPYVDIEPSETRTWLLGQRKWRYHHGIEELRETDEFYAAYSDRVEAMLGMVDTALDASGVVLGNTSFIDLGAAEGYTANHLFDRGAVDVDSCDLNKDGIERLWRIRAYTDRSFGRVGVLDLDHAGWAMELGRSYDVALALGVIYHVENPLLFARNLRHITRRIAIIESDTPVFPQNER